jgi:hypothetical protein
MLLSKTTLLDHHNCVYHRRALVGANAASFAVVIVNASDLALFQDKAEVRAGNPAVEALDAEVEINQGTFAATTPKAGLADGGGPGLLRNATGGEFVPLG